jgi:glycosyltransferase involved in cell wall biosynthesis
MRIVLVGPFPPLRGGIAMFNHSLAETLSKNHEVHRVSFSLQYPQLLFPGKTQYFDYDSQKAKTLINSVNPFSWKKTVKYINSINPDIVIFQYWMPFFALCLGFVAKRLRKKRVKVISVLHNVKPHENRIGDKRLSRYFLKQNDAFVVMSKAVRDDLLSFIQDAKYILHPFPIYSQFGDSIDQIEARKKIGIPLNKKVLLFFGLIRNYKGLDLIIDAFDKLSDEYFLVIAGESYGKFDDYQKQIDSNTNKERIIKHIKFITDDQVSFFISAADLNVLPYKTATQSAVVAMAYQFDSPVLVTDVGGLKGMVEPYETGVVVDAPDSVLISEGIETFFNDNMKSNCKNNIQKYKADYSWDNFVKVVLELVES